MSETDVDQSIREKPCPLCDHADYTWANAIYIGHDKMEGNIQLREKNPDPRPEGVVGAVWSKFLREPLLARKCNHYGNVQLFTAMNG